ncbi:hypothetical protein ASZ78_004648, partial [Callipepla squamata]
MAAKDNPCRKFQANIFNKSKCQNCFKPRESHLLNDEDLNQAKPIYGGWLLLAPEGTDFDNPVHRSRKWQRRFFILYEHGLLRYALDEMPTTLPQGTINMNQCTDVVDGESRTGQKFSLCILTPEKEHFIRAENKEIISGQKCFVCSVLALAALEGEGPLVAGNADSLPEDEQAEPKEEEEGRAPNSSDESSMNGDRIDCGRKTRVESGYFSLEKTKQDSKLEEQQLPPPASPPSPSTPNNSRQYTTLADVPKAVRISNREAFQVERKRLERRTRARSPGREEVARLFGNER